MLHSVSSEPFVAYLSMDFLFYSRLNFFRAVLGLQYDEEEGTTEISPVLLPRRQPTPLSVALTGVVHFLLSMNIRGHIIITQQHL